MNKHEKWVALLRSLALICFAGFLLAGCSKNEKASEANQEATLAELNRAYASWEMISIGPPPTTVDGLTNSALIKGKRLPRPPEGKKLTLVPDRRQVVLVDQ